jgi:hypothetical protein
MPNLTAKPLTQNRWTKRTRASPANGLTCIALWIQSAIPIDVLLSPHRDLTAAKLFLRLASCGRSPVVRQLSLLASGERGS